MRDKITYRTPPHCSYCGISLGADNCYKSASTGKYMNQCISCNRDRLYQRRWYARSKTDTGKEIVRLQRLLRLLHERLEGNDKFGIGKKMG